MEFALSLSLLRWRTDEGEAAKLKAARDKKAKRKQAWRINEAPEDPSRSAEAKVVLCQLTASGHAAAAQAEADGSFLVKVGLGDGEQCAQCAEPRRRSAPLPAERENKRRCERPDTRECSNVLS
jgi:hypothetical protein